MSSKYYSKSEATRLIKTFARNSSIRNTKHAKERMKERSIDMHDILSVFRNGSVLDEPRLDIKTNLWKYNIIGNGIDCNRLTVTVVINAIDKCITIITVF
ncbi:MAG: DUF4258 domain-containing protein [Nitrospirae bacterium]|nr:DUF4258 domain-containing protein [Nitrospirota bacterium]